MSEYIDEAKFNQILNGRNCGDQFTIAEISTENNILEIIVRYGGGCKNHDFNVFWNGKIDFKWQSEFLF